MTEYAVHFEWLDPVAVETEPRYQLRGNTLGAAKLEAALLFADVEFGSPPAAYRIFQNGDAEVYRYPETPNPASPSTSSKLRP